MSGSPDKPCSKGHISPRRKNGNCIQCERLRYHDDPARAAYVKAKQAERRAAIKANPVLLKQQKEYMRTYAQENRQRLNEQNKLAYRKNKIEIRLRRKGIEVTPELLEHIEQHDGTCTICGRPPDGRWGELVFDHCHMTNQFRGLLCNRCNKGIGLFRDNPDALQQAAAYIAHYTNA